MTRLLVASCLAGSLVAAGHAQSQNISIHGRVVSNETNEALPHARVVIYNDAAPLAPVFTDEQGRFASPALPAGRYRLTAAKSGYTPTTVGRVDRTAEAIEVRLSRSGAISGRVLDPDGEPVIGIAVSAMIPVPGGSPTLVKTVGTNDLGEYRLGGLAEGSYVVCINQLSIDPAGGVTRALSFYPGAALPEQAQAIAVHAGDQKTGVDLTGTLAAPLPFTVAAQMISQPGMRITIGNPAALASTAPKGTSIIRGRITRADGLPLAHASVTAAYDNAGTRNPVPPKSTTTNDDGTYELSELPRGSYRVNATKPGYTGGAYGQKPDSADRPAVLNVADNDVRAQVDIALPKYSAIAGDVFDDFGDPVEGVSVSVSQIRFTGGRRRLVGTGAQAAVTDDLGHYRIYGIRPGDYVVAASAGQVDPGGLTADISGFAPTYFPGTTTANEARQIAVTRGQDLSGIDVMLIPQPTARVAGRKIGSDGLPLGGSLVLIESQRSGALVTPPIGARIELDGRFEFPNVAPGEYVIQADQGRRGGNNAEGEFVSQFVTVNGADVTGLVLEGTPGSSISGRVVFDGDGAPPDPAFDIVPARADADRTPLNGGSIARAEVQPDLTFELTGIHGPRRLTIDRRPPGWDLEAVIANGVDVTDAVLPFGTQEQSLADVQVVLTDRVTEVSGTAVDARGNVTTDYALLIFPSNRELWYPGSRFLRRSGPQSSGNFRVTGLPPGDYFVAAVSGMSVLRQGAEAWQDPEFLETLTAHAARATLTDGQHLAVSARVITP